MGSLWGQGANWLWQFLLVQGLRAWRFGVVGCFCAGSFGLKPKPLNPQKP